MLGKLYNFILKKICVLLFIFYFCYCIPSDIFDEAQRYILNLFEPKEYFEIQKAYVTSEKSKIDEYKYKLIYSYYDYYFKKNGFAIRNFTNNDAFGVFFTLLSRYFEENREKADSSISDEDLFNKFINTHKQYDMSYKVFSTLYSDINDLVDNFASLINRAISSGYSKYNRIVSGNRQDRRPVIYDINNKKIENYNFNELEVKLLNIEMFVNSLDKGFYEILDLNKENIIEINSKGHTKNDLKEYHSCYKLIIKYAKQHNLNVKFKLDDCVIVEEVIFGNFNRFCDINDYREADINNIYFDVVDSNNVNYLIKFINKNKINRIIFEIPSGDNPNDYLRKFNCSYGDNIPSDMIFSFKKKENYNKNINAKHNNKIILIPGYVAPVDDISHILFEKESNKNIIESKSIFLKDFEDSCEKSIKEALAANKINFSKWEDLCDFFLRDVYDKFINSVRKLNDINNNEEFITFNASDINFSLNLLMNKIIERNNIKLNENAYCVQSYFINKLILNLKDISKYETKKTIVFQYNSNNLTQIKKYIIDTESFEYLSPKELQKKIKKNVFQEVKKKQMGFVDNDILEKAYGEILYHGLFSLSELVNCTNELYLIYKDNYLLEEKKVKKCNEFLQKIYYDITQKDLGKYFIHKENKPDIVFFNDKLELSHKDQSFILNKLNLTAIDIKNLGFYLSEKYKCGGFNVIRKNIVKLIKLNEHVFEEIKNDKNAVISMIKQLIRRSTRGLYSDYEEFKKINDTFNSEDAFSVFWRRKKEEYNRQHGGSTNTKAYFDFIDININNIIECDERKVFKRYKTRANKSFENYNRLKFNIPSLSGEAGTGKTESFYWFVGKTLKEARERGWNRDIYFKVFGKMGSEFVSGAQDQVHTSFNWMREFKMINGDYLLLILADECDKWVPMDGMEENGKSRVAAQGDLVAALKQEWQNTELCSLMMTSNYPLDNIKDVGLKSRLVEKGDHILYVTSIDLESINILVGDECLKKNVNIDLNYDDLQRIGCVINFAQRNLSNLEDIMNYYIKYNKEDLGVEENTKRFMYIVNSFLRNQKLTEDIKFTETSSEKFIEKKEEDNKFEPAKIAEPAMAFFGHGKESAIKILYDSVMQFAGSFGVNVTVGALTWIGYYLGLRKIFPDWDWEDSGKKIALLMSGACGAVASGLPKSYLAYHYCGYGNFLEFYGKHWNEAYLPNFDDGSKVGINWVENIKNSKKKESDEKEMLIKKGYSYMWESSSSLSSSLECLKSYKFFIKDYVYGDFPNTELLFNESKEEFELRYKNYNEKRVEFCLYLEKNYVNIYDVIVNKIGLLDKKELFNGSSLFNMIFEAAYLDRKHINHKVLQYLDSNIKQYCQETSMFSRLSKYCNLKNELEHFYLKNNNESEFSSNLEVEIEDLSNEIYRSFLNFIDTVKYKIPQECYNASKKFAMKYPFLYISKLLKESKKNQDEELAKTLKNDLNHDNILLNKILKKNNNIVNNSTQEDDEDDY